MTTDDPTRTVVPAVKLYEENRRQEDESKLYDESAQAAENFAKEKEARDEKAEELLEKKEAYHEYVKKISPKKNLPAQMAKAFLTGGAICLIGQGILNTCQSFGLDKDTSGAWCSLILVLMSVLLTSFSIYQYIAAWGGAGALVPITGFANSVCSPAIEYKPEGQVFGIGVKIFTIAGPVILYGIFASWVCGFLYWLFGQML